MNYNFTYSTSSYEELTNTNIIPNCDAHILIYIQDGDIKFSVAHEDTHEDTLAALISSLPNTSFIAELVDSIINVLPNGSDIGEKVFEALSINEEELEELESMAVIQPIDIFRRRNNVNEGD